MVEVLLLSTLQLDKQNGNRSAVCLIVFITTNMPFAIHLSYAHTVAHLLGSLYLYAL